MISEISDSVKTESVFPVRLGMTGNIIVCSRLDAKEMAKRVEMDVRNAPNESSVAENEIYAVKCGKKWVRAKLKFRRPDGLAVLHYLDEAGLYNFYESKSTIRKVRDPTLRREKFGHFKMFIYGIGPFDQKDEEFVLIFQQLLANQKCTAIYSLIEHKENDNREAFAGDLLYDFGGKYHSFREVLIREKIAYVAQVQAEINQQLFHARANFLAVHNAGISTLFSTMSITKAKSIKPIKDEPIEIVANRYSLYELIGEGSFGAVFRGRDLVTNQKIAAKVFKVSLFGEQNLGLDECHAEAKVARALKHANIMELLNMIEDNGCHYLIFPLMFGSLFDEIYSENYEFSEKRTKQVVAMLLSALKYMHEMKYIHRDLKPENVLMDCHGSVKIADFGLSVELDHGKYLMTKCGTKRYIAPEVFLKFGYDFKADIWAVGCILAELKLIDTIVSGSHKNQLKNIFELFGTPTYEIWPVCDWKTRYGIPIQGRNLEEIFDPDFLSLLRCLCSINPQIERQLLKQ